MSEMKQGDIVQITKEDDAWFPSLLIVSDVTLWGVEAYCIMPNSNDGSEKVGNAYRRLGFGMFEKVGSAVIVVGEETS